MTDISAYRTAQRIKLEMALALIGKPREVCSECGRPPGQIIRGIKPHTPRSAALFMGINPQTVWRALKRPKD